MSRRPFKTWGTQSAGWEAEQGLIFCSMHTIKNICLCTARNWLKWRIIGRQQLVHWANPKTHLSDFEHKHPRFFLPSWFFFKLPNLPHFSSKTRVSIFTRIWIDCMSSLIWWRMLSQTMTNWWRISQITKLLSLTMPTPNWWHFRRHLTTEWTKDTN